MAYSNRGYARSELGDNQGAIADYDRAIQRDPKFAFNYGRRGWLRYKKFKDLPNALADMDQAIRLDPKLGIAYQSRGNIHSTLGNLQEALSDFNQAIQLEPNSSFNYYFRGLHFLKIQLKNTQRIRPNSKLTQSAISDFEHSASLFKSEGNNKFYLRSLEILGKIRN